MRSSSFKGITLQNVLLVSNLIFSYLLLFLCADMLLFQKPKTKNVLNQQKKKKNIFPKHRFSYLCTYIQEVLGLINFDYRVFFTFFSRNFIKQKNNNNKTKTL